MTSMARCRDGHLEPTTAKARTKCRHLLTADEARARGAAPGTRCARPANVVRAAEDQAAGADPAQDDEASLEQRWAAESAPAPWHELLGEECGDVPCDEDVCEECPPPRYTGAHTATICPECSPQCWTVSPAASQRASEHAEGLERRRARASGAELDIIDPDAEIRAARARAQLRAQKEALALLARQLEGVTMPEAHIRPQYKRLGFDIGATLRGWLPEIAAAADEVTIARIAAELEQIRTSPEYRQLEHEAAEVRQQRERQQYQAELEQQRAAAEARQLAELERQQAEARRQAAAQQRRQIPAGRTVTVQPRPTGDLAQGLALVLGPVVKRQHDKEQRRARNGECGWCKSTAERIYGIPAGTIDQLGNPAPHPQMPQIRSCKKHFADANQWIESSRGQLQAFYWELSG